MEIIKNQTTEVTHGSDFHTDDGLCKIVLTELKESKMLDLNIWVAGKKIFNGTDTSLVLKLKQFFEQLRFEVNWDSYEKKKDENVLGTLDEGKIGMPI